MKKIQILFAVIFAGFILTMFVRQCGSKDKLYKESLNGRVVSFEKGNKGYYHMKIIEEGKLKQLGFIPVSTRLMVSVGDSISKEINSEIFYIKKEGMSGFVKADWIDVYISGKWEE